MEEQKKNVPLILALSIPVVMIVLTTLSIYVPSLFVKPTTDFIYSVGGSYCNETQYLVRGEKIVETQNKLPENNTCTNVPPMRLFYYDVKQDAARELSLEEARRFIVVDTAKSWDGFEVVSGGRGDGIFFSGYSSYGDRFLQKGAFSRKLNLRGLGSSSYYYDFRFMGWVKGENHG